MTPSLPASKIVVLGTGGTIAGTASTSADATGYCAAQRGIEQLLENVPGLADLAIESEQVAQVDSKDMSHAIWQALALRVAHHLERDDVGGIVVTHGTDTLEETAYFLQRVLVPQKPVVLTAAMRPATSLQADGPQNLLDALTVARHPAVHGVTVVLAGTVHAAQRVRKVHPYRLDAFSSGEVGPLGAVENGLLRLFRRDVEAQTSAPISVALTRPVSVWPRVQIVHSHAGADGAVVRALCGCDARGGRQVDGLVAAATGNGTLHHDLEAALLSAQSQGVAVLISLRCGDGRLLPVASHRLPGADDLTPVTARIALMLELMQREAG